MVDGAGAAVGEASFGVVVGVVGGEVIVVGDDVVEVVVVDVVVVGVTITGGIVGGAVVVVVGGPVVVDVVGGAVSVGSTITGGMVGGVLAAGWLAGAATVSSDPPSTRPLTVARTRCRDIHRRYDARLSQA